METDSCTIRFYCRNKVAWLPGKMKMQHEAVNSTAVALTTTFPCPAITTRVWQTVTCSERLQHCKLNQTQPALWPQGGKKTDELWILWKQDLNQKLKSVRKNILLFSLLAPLLRENESSFFELHFVCSVCGFWHSWTPICSPRQQSRDLKTIMRRGAVAFK